MEKLPNNSEVDDLLAVIRNAVQSGQVAGHDPRELSQHIYELLEDDVDGFSVMQAIDQWFTEII